MASYHADPVLSTQPADRSAGGTAGHAVTPPFAIADAVEPRTPFVFASPHSGRVYPAGFLAGSRLDKATLRRSEDAFVDRIFTSAPKHGAALIRARFPRSFVDANRSPREFDPMLFAESLDRETIDETPHVKAGFGVVPRIVSADTPIYDRALTRAEAEDRIARHHAPYHASLASLIETTRERFGVCFLIDCHSMPSAPYAHVSRANAGSIPDVVLGDRHGQSCASGLTDAVEELLLGQGFSVRRNLPYAGAFTTARYGSPAVNVHAIQIELNRGLYLDEGRIVPGPGMASVVACIAAFVAGLTARHPESLVDR